MTKCFVMFFVIVIIFSIWNTWSTAVFLDNRTHLRLPDLSCGSAGIVPQVQTQLHCTPGWPLFASSAPVFCSEFLQVFFLMSILSYRRSFRMPKVIKSITHLPGGRVLPGLKTPWRPVSKRDTADESPENGRFGGTKVFQHGCIKTTSYSAGKCICRRISLMVTMY